MNASRIGIVATKGMTDFTYNLTDVALFGGFELWFGTIVVCIPPLRTLFVDTRAPESTLRPCRTGDTHQTSPSFKVSETRSWTIRSKPKSQGSMFDDDDVPLAYHSQISAKDRMER